MKNMPDLVLNRLRRESTNRYGMMLPFAYFFFVLFLLLPTARAENQVDSTLYHVINLPLDSLDKDVRVYYSPGYYKRAYALSDLCYEAIKFFERTLGLQIPFRLAVLDEEHWAEIRTDLGSVPYGVPFVSENAPYVAILPALPEKSVLYNSSIEQRDLPSDILHQLRKLKLTIHELSIHSLDGIGIHEMGHAYIRELDMKPAQHWFDELMASYFMAIFEYFRHGELYQLQQQLGRYIVNSPDSWAKTYKPTHRSLDDFNELYFKMGHENYVWYQMMFQTRVNQMLVNADSISAVSFITDVRDKQLFKETDVRELIIGLEEISPGFLKWFESLQ